MVFLVEDSNTGSEVVGISLLVQEDREIFKWLIDAFKLSHDNHSQIKCFMADKDLLERDVLREVFPNVPIYICRYHVLKTFSRQIPTRRGETQMKEICLKLLQDMVYSGSMEEYTKIYKLLCEVANREILEYFNKNWHNIFHEWTAFSMRDQNLGNFTNNRLESINKHLKAVIPKRSSQLQFLGSFFVWLQFHNNESDYKTSNAFLKQPVDATNLLLDEKKFMAILMPIPFKKVKDEIAASTDRILAVKYCIRKKQFSVKEAEETFKATPTDCECSFLSSMASLPCKHIFAVRKFLKMPLFAPELCPQRWTKESMLETHPRLRDSGITKSSTKTTPLLRRTSKEDKRRKLNVNGKRKIMKPILDDILVSCSESCSSDFDKKKHQLILIQNAWRQGLDLEVKVKKDGKTQQDSQIEEHSLPSSFIESVLDISQLSLDSDKTAS
ncbi:uncharacterized protein LOC118752089 [Rhagoletis pomonella]|uniref:uncharacterized protein LOC118752089 n=1 Tax=Rhagoletis pomonella TaxID=28610 RepID=UPI0017818D55|nr:uncharacterized protein LOC118752089 [Rhagoletis pomonella]